MKALLIVLSAALFLRPGSAAAEAVNLTGLSCDIPEYHCPAADCPAETIAQRGNVTDILTGRNFFLDYPCDLQKGEAVLFVLNLHGGGSIGNWQRHYFPLLDLKDEYRLIVATPSGVVRAWVPGNDDEHLQNIVDYVYRKFADANVAGFWLAGHSQGGQTANRLINDERFASHLTGWVSIAGGRLGSERSTIRAPIPRSVPRPATMDRTGPPRLVAYAEELPDAPFSHIYVTGEHEIPESRGKRLPLDSPWAQKLGCGARQAMPEVVDTLGGYVYDSREQPNRNAIWGLDPGPGTATVHTFPGCDEGRVVADIVRLNKGHTEGLEPNVTRRIVELMWQASRPD